MRARSGFGPVMVAVLLVMSCLAALLAPVSAEATPVDNGLGAGGGTQGVVSDAPVGLGGPWQEFLFTTVGVNAGACTSCTPSSGGNSVFAPASPWTFACPWAACQLTVQDAFLRGDSFNVFDNAVLIGSTSLVAASGSCPGDATNPDVCATDPLTSRGTFILLPGPHSITIQPNVSPFGGGAAYFRIDPAPNTPVPTLSEWAMILMAALLVGFGLWSVRGRIGFGGRPA